MVEIATRAQAMSPAPSDQAHAQIVELGYRKPRIMMRVDHARLDRLTLLLPTQARSLTPALADSPCSCA
jgi:hypothetical protein